MPEFSHREPFGTCYRTFDETVIPKMSDAKTVTKKSEGAILTSKVRRSVVRVGRSILLVLDVRLH